MGMTIWFAISGNCIGLQFMFRRGQDIIPLLLAHYCIRLLHGADNPCVLA